MTIATRYPTTDAAVSGSWTNPTNVQADDGAVAAITRGTTKNTQDDREQGGYGFDAAIPAGATINSVAIEVEHRVQTTSNVCFLENFGVVGGVNGAVNSDSLEPITLTARSYGSYARPGGGGWTRADLLDANFKTRIRARNGNNATSNTWEWDYIRVVVDYTAGQTFQQALAVASTFVAALARATTFARALAVASTFGAALGRILTRAVSLAVGSTFAATLAKAVTFRQALAVASSFVVAAGKTVSKTLAVASSFATGLVKRVGVRLDATVSMTPVLGVAYTAVRTLAVQSVHAVALSRGLTYARALVVSSVHAVSLAAQKIVGAALSLVRRNRGLPPPLSP